jgi:hypothetical protein
MEEQTHHLSLDSKSRIYRSNNDVQGVPEMDGKILTTSSWLHVELGKNIQKILLFLKYDIQGCIFKMCRNFTYEVVGQRRRLKAIKKTVPQKLNVILFFDIEFFKYFFRVLHEASSSWLKFCRTFQKHPVHS